MPGTIGIGNGQITLGGLPLPHSADSRSQPPGLLRVTAEHMEQALLGVKRRTASALGAPSVPEVKKPSPHKASLRILACLDWSMLKEVLDITSACQAFWRHVWADQAYRVRSLGTHSCPIGSEVWWQTIMLLSSGHIPCQTELLAEPKIACLYCIYLAWQGSPDGQICC